MIMLYWILAIYVYISIVAEREVALRVSVLYKNISEITIPRVGLFSVYLLP